MKKLLCALLLTFSMTFGFTGLVYAASPADDAKGAVCDGIGDTVGASCDAGGEELTNIVGVVLEILSIIAGIVAVFAIVIAGFKYVTSGGDAGKLSSAKSTLIYAIVGLVIVASAQFIVQFVLGSATA